MRREGFEMTIGPQNFSKTTMMEKNKNQLKK